MPFSAVGLPVWRAVCDYGEVVGLGCFGYQQSFSKFFSKLVKSYVLDALDWLEEQGKDQVPMNL